MNMSGYWDYRGNDDISGLSVAEKLLEKSETSMKKEDVTSTSLNDDAMRPEYDFGGGVRGKHYQAYQRGHTGHFHT